VAQAKKDPATGGVQGPHGERLLSAREVAWLLSVSTKTIYRLKAEGRITFIKVRGSLRFREEDVRELQNRGLVTPRDYARKAAEIPVRLNLAFDIKKRGRGPRRR